MKNSKEAITLRRKNIVQLLQTMHKVDVVALAKRLNVTTATIRRDLSVLENEGSVKRYFGGAQYALPPNVDVQYQTPLGNPTPKKIALAQYAASMVVDGDIVFLNSSSTVLNIIDYLENISASIITNNGRALHVNRKLGVDLLLTGGEVYGNKQSLVGEFAVNSIRKVIANKCFLGASGISAEGGVTSSIIQEVMINQQMIAQCSGPKILVADSSKIGMRQSFFNFTLEAVTHLITDSDADPAELDQIRAMGVEIIVVQV